LGINEKSKFKNQLVNFLLIYYVADLSSRYKHFGQFAPLGGEQTAAQLPGDWVSIGRSSQWLCKVISFFSSSSIFFLLYKMLNYLFITSKNCQNSEQAKIFEIGILWYNRSQRINI